MERRVPEGGADRVRTQMGGLASGRTPTRTGVMEERGHAGSGWRENASFLL